VDGVDDVIAGAIELLLGVLEVLANLPHQQLDHRVALFAHARQKALDMGDALGHAHGRPGTATVVIGGDSGVQCKQRGVGIQQRRAAEDHLMLAAIGLAQKHRAANFGQRAVPVHQLAIDQIIALRHRCVRTIGFGNLIQTGEKLGKRARVAHATSR